MKVTTIGGVDMTSEQAEAVYTLLQDWRHTTAQLTLYQVEETMQVVIDTDAGTLDILTDGSIHS